jgi:4-hydroxy-L-threonine phosphate dehydrogenase PdxA
MTTTVQPTIAIIMGDPVGIGPEIIVKVLADHGREKRRGPKCSRELRAERCPLEEGGVKREDAEAQ